MARLYAESQRTDRTCNQDFVRGRFACFRGYFHAAAVEALDYFGEPERCKLEAVRTKRISFDDVRARFDVGLVDAKYRFRLGRIQLIKAALRANSLVQHRAHRAIGDEDGVFQPLVKILDLQGSCFLSVKNLVRKRR